MVLSLDRWVGKIAIVTGASSGIGAATAELLVKNGLTVVGLARRSEIIEDNARKLSEEKGTLYAFKSDMTKEEDILKAFQWIEENLGHVHILINNAGVSMGNFLSSGSTESWRTTLEVNVLGLSIATREAVKIMTANKIEGHIIHINSVVGHRIPHCPGLNVYGASKYAVTALTETLKHEFIRQKSKIKITSVSPGLTLSELTVYNSHFSKKRVEELKKMPILEAKDVAEAIGFVLSTPAHVQIEELTVTPVGSEF